MVYEELKKAASGPLMRDDGSKQPLNSLEISVIGAVSKLAASIVTYPSQAHTDIMSLIPMHQIHEQCDMCTVIICRHEISCIEMSTAAST